MTATTISPATTPLDTQAVRQALASQSRPARASAATASVILGERALRKIKHVPEQLADSLLIPILFTVLFTYLFGGALAGSTSEYLQFLLPGTLVFTVLLITVYAGVGLNQDVSRGVFDRFRSLPIWRPAPIVGGLIGDVARALLASTTVIALGLVMGYRPEGGVTGVLLAVGLILVFAFSLAWVWTTIGLVARTPASVTMLSFVVQFPLTFASNVFVEPKTMPGWLETLVTINPVSHLVTAVRGLMGGTATAGQVGWVLVASALLLAVFAPLTMYLYGKRG
ncbi:MAG TPA: ABC transporter permease [Thermomicrobiales bacterium]|nr:ABC transporter permease [Thermomicrobiales bacterium]